MPHKDDNTVEASLIKAITLRLNRKPCPSLEALEKAAEALGVFMKQERPAFLDALQKSGVRKGGGY